MINETYVEFIEQQFNIEQNRPFKAITSIAVEKLISKKECVCECHWKCIQLKGNLILNIPNNVEQQSPPSLFYNEKRNNNEMPGKNSIQVLHMHILIIPGWKKGFTSYEWMKLNVCVRM